MLFRALLIACLPLPAFACGHPICRVDPGSLELTRIINFDDMQSAWDPGFPHDEPIRMDGASFAERFAGQSLSSKGDFDQVNGPALPPLTLVPGAPGQTLSVARVLGSNTLNGFGPAGFPRTNAQGEGAIAVLFDDDQPAFSLEILGGEKGTATLMFLRRDGTIIHAITIANLARASFGFRRAGDIPDIAGFVLTNTDPQGVAIDNLRFAQPPQLG